MGWYLLPLRGVRQDWDHYQCQPLHPPLRRCWHQPPPHPHSHRYPRCQPRRSPTPPPSPPTHPSPPPPPPPPSTPPPKCRRYFPLPPSVTRPRTLPAQCGWMISAKWVRRTISLPRYCWGSPMGRRWIGG